MKVMEDKNEDGASRSLAWGQQMQTSATVVLSESPGFGTRRD